jgi:plasmid stabilization system protein ParE
MTPDPLDSLSGQAAQVLRDVARYGLTTAAAERRLRYPDLTEDALRKLLARMTERGWLARHPLHGQEPYFVLAHPALAALGLRRSPKALGHQALLEHYAVLLACARRGGDVFTEDEFRARFPDLTEPGLSAKNLFFDTGADPPRLGWFVVDHDKLSSRMVGKVGRRVARLLAADRPALRRLVLAGQFAVRVVTATEGKRQNLEAAFARKPFRNVAVTVEAHPDELGDFFLVKRR